jgi:adenylate kinase family enzyme
MGAPFVVILAGPNGAGKSTASQKLLAECSASVSS